MPPLGSSDNVLKNPGVLTTLLYIFVAIIPHAVAPRYMLAGAMLLVFLYQLFRGQLQKPALNFFTWGALGVFAATVFSAVLSPYYSESLPLLRKETLPFVVGFLLLCCQKISSVQRETMVRYLFLAVIAGFTIKLFLAIGDGIAHDWRFVVYDYPAQQKPRYLDFFVADIYYYLPFLLAPLCFWPMKRAYRLALAVVVGLTVLFAINSGIRTSFLLVTGTVALFVLIRFWAYKMWFAVACVALALGAYFAKDYVTHPEKQRYYRIFSAQTYQLGNDGSVSERFAIARSVWEVNQERIWLGYGPDWKKLPIVAEQGGFLEKWKRGSEPWHPWASNYYTNNSYGQVNPHNFYLMAMFEVGVIGLTVYLLLLLAIAVRGLRLSLNPQNDRIVRSTGFALLAYVGAYLSAGFTGGPWLPVTLLVTASLAAMLKQPECCSNDR